jgi:hypothetical protein
LTGEVIVEEEEEWWNDEREEAQRRWKLGKNSRKCLLLGNHLVEAHTGGVGDIGRGLAEVTDHGEKGFFVGYCVALVNESVSGSGSMRFVVISGVGGREWGETWW